jgi:hypothetical protein
VKDISVILLERGIEELEQQKNSAVRAAAKPFDDKILLLRQGIAKLENKELPTVIVDTNVVAHTYKGSKRGRKARITTSFVYPKNGTVLSKLLYVIKEAGRFLTIGEIANCVKVYEPNVSADLIKMRFGKHIDKYKKLGHLVSYVVGSRRNTVYGLPTWYSEGKPSPGREHDPDALIDKITIGVVKQGYTVDGEQAEYEATKTYYQGMYGK